MEENLSGSNVKGYELVERIGSGGFGAVYRAYQSSVKREVAIKIILPHFANHPDFIRRFELEAELVAHLEHPHIVPLYDYWRDPQGAYLVMRWLRGGSLREALKGGPFTLQAATLLLDQATSALALAHRNQIIHRDLKPANILLDEDGNAYVADFGIAKDLGSTKDNLTQADAVVGSPDYLSPEQARSEPVSPRTDIYSLGVILYEVLTGQHPFPNLTPVGAMFKHLNDPLPPITTLTPQDDQAVNAVIQRATAKNPAQRYPDVGALAAAFQQAVGQHPSHSGERMVEALTQREQEILRRIIDGQSNKQIAQELFITIATVKWYITQIYSKLGVRSRVQAMVRARDLNLIAPSQTTSPTLIPTDQFAPDNPYKGLRAFQAADCQDFFGREALTERLVKRLSETGEMARFLAVIGPSGSGKSSLVKAGLIPALWQGAIPGSDRWFVVEMLPGAHPLDELEVVLTRVAAKLAANLHEQLERDERGLLRVAQLVLPRDDSQLMLIIDQFEEVFTLVDDEQVRVHFLKLIREAIDDPRSRVRVVVTLRADFYDRPLLYPDFGELVRSRMETVLPLTADGLERAIARPAERVGVTFESGLVASIVSEVNYQPGALPLLQYALTELFEHRQGRILSREAYQTIGGTVGALARRADELYAGLGSQEQETVRQMFLRLVTLGEGVEDTRRRVPRSELIAIAADEDTVDDLIDTYAAYRLLSLDHDPATRSPTVELAHEAILREWRRLHGWLNESRHDIRMQRLLATAATEWLQANREDSFLLRGSRLDQFQAWATDTRLALTQKERAYLDASLAERERQILAEQKRQAHEKSLERRSRNFLRGLVVVLVVASLVGFGLAAVAITQSRIAQQNAAESQNVALVAGSQAALANGNTDLAIALALQAVGLYPTSTSAQVALGQAAYATGTVRRFTGHTGAIWSVTFSPDGRTALSGSDDRTLMLWDVATGQILRRFTGGHSSGHIEVAFSPDGRTALSSADDGRVILWDIATGSMLRRFEGHTAGVGGVAFSPDGRTLLSSSADKTVILWDVATGAMIRQFTGHTDVVEDVIFSADGRTALSGSADKTVIHWDVTTGAAIRRFKGEAYVYKVALSPDGRYALAATNDTFIYLWDVATGTMIRRFKGHDTPIYGIMFSPDGRTALSAGSDQQVIWWDVETGQILKHFVGHTGMVNRVTFSPDGRYALSGSSDQTLRLWDLVGGQVIRRFVGHTGPIWGGALSPDGRTALSSSWDGNAILWGVQTGREKYRLTAGQMWGSAFSPDGHTALVAISLFGTNFIPSDIILWNVDTGQEIRRLVGHQAAVIPVAFSPDGRTALSGTNNGEVFLWDLATGQVLRRFVGNTGTVFDVTFSPDGRTALSGNFDGTIILWDVATGQIIRRLPGYDNIVSDTQFSRDGRVALISGGAGIWRWDIVGDTTRRLPSFGHMALSPDQGTALTMATDQGTILMDMTTGTVLRRFGEDRGFNHAAFSADGRSILVGLPDGRLELWRNDSLDALIQWTHGNRYVMELDCEQRQLYRLATSCDTNDLTPTGTPVPSTPLPVVTEAALPR